MIPLDCYECTDGITYRTREPSSQKIVCSSMVLQKIVGQNTLYSFNYGSWNNYTQQNESITNKSVCREKSSFSMVYVGLEWQFCWLMKPDFVENHAFWQKILDTKSQVHRKEYIFSTSVCGPELPFENLSYLVSSKRYWARD